MDKNIDMKININAPPPPPPPPPEEKKKKNDELWCALAQNGLFGISVKFDHENQGHPPPPPKKKKKKKKKIDIDI